MLSWAARDRFLSSTKVTVVPVVVTRAEIQQAGTPLFQAAGWIEARPTPVLVSALTEGIVADLLVVEGQEIEANQPVARLIDADAKLALEQAQADLELQTSGLESAQAELESARLKVKYPVHLQAALSDAESVLAKSEGELARVPFQLQAAKSRHDFAAGDLTAKQSAGTSVAGRALLQAQSDHDSTLAELNELTGRPQRLQREIQALRAKLEALSTQLELLIEEKRQLGLAEGQCRSAKSRVKQAALAVRTAELRLERTTITSPVAGRVLALVTRPGSRVMGLDPSGEQKANTIVTLYDPHMLQVRADVRLEDVPMIQANQPVRIETASFKGTIQGLVLRATSQANIQKNTLEVKVAIVDPPPAIRPEMLVTATFLALEQPGDKLASKQQERLLVPRQLIESDGDAKTVWIADANGLARRKSLKLGNAGTDELVEVLEGLSPTDRLISGNREALNEGARITISGEDATIGMPRVN
jgi:multidrug efflux pump subunit AcrA (membrane-fusion protein)